MRTILEEHVGHRIYVFSTQGHVYAGKLAVFDADCIELVAPDGQTRISVRLADILSVRAWDEQPEEVSP